MTIIKQNEKDKNPLDTHFNNDESFYYHLKDIKFDIFLTVHFKKKKFYSKSIDSHCNRKNFFRETFGNLTRYLEIPHKSLFYFGIAERDCNDKMHCHLLVKFRKDLKLSDEEKVKGINKIFLLGWDYFRFKDTNQRNVEVVSDSQDATNYMLKIKTFYEKESNTKENYYHSKNFTQICKYMKEGLW
jgi:hypothetical protein